MDFKTSRSFLGGFCIAFALGVVVLALLVNRAVTHYRIKSEEGARLRFENWISEARRELSSGKTSGLMVESTTNTDAWIARFGKMPEIKHLYFVSTDITDKGVEVISQLPNLRDLVLGYGRTRVTDVGIERLSQNQSLETLRLYNLDISDEGLANLGSLSKLKALTIYSEPARKKGLTDSGSRFLQKLSNLKRLEVGGGWLTPDKAEELRKALPNCEIVENVETDTWTFELSVTFSPFIL